MTGDASRGFIKLLECSSRPSSSRPSLSGWRRPALLSLGKLMAAVYLTCLVFVFVVLGLIAATVGFNLLKFLKHIGEEILIVLGTSSSESVLPRIMTKLEHLGCSRPVVGLVIPTGYSFNLDGTSIYMTHVAQASR